jgi:NADH dehydrogenase/NADH:ubiquinone oxidoreductase subunit G
LPTTIWAEKSGTLVNTEGRSLAMQAALKPPMSVMDDGAILTALEEKLG